MARGSAGLRRAKGLKSRAAALLQYRRNTKA
jgi:hypothetical protein